VFFRADGQVLKVCGLHSSIPEGSVHTSSSSILFGQLPSCRASKRLLKAPLSGRSFFPWSQASARRAQSVLFGTFEGVPEWMRAEDSERGIVEKTSTVKIMKDGAMTPLKLSVIDEILCHS